MTVFKGCLAHSLGFSGDAVVKNQPANAGDARDAGSITGSGRFLGEGNGYQLQYSCLESSMDRGAWRATVHGVTKSLTQLKQLSRYLSCNKGACICAGCFTSSFPLNVPPDQIEP